MIATLLHSTYYFMILSCASAAILLFGPLKINGHVESRVHHSMVDFFYELAALHQIPQSHRVSYSTLIFFSTFCTCTVLFHVGLLNTADIDLPFLTLFTCTL